MVVLMKIHNHCYYKVFLGNAHINNIKVLCYGRLDFSKGINVDKTSASTEGTICHYWYFFA